MLLNYLEVKFKLLHIDIRRFIKYNIYQDFVENIND